MFSNLINNAVQHGDGREPVTVTLEVTADKLLFSVHNSGTVIPVEVLPFIFNPMGRYSPQASIDHGPYSSLGLGLFIADQIVGAHGGCIEVSSATKTGTKFAVVLPMQ
ncbi:Sensor histidine kinase ResE [Pseudomonas fluorescens]|uniref:histidine kinase n=1 Tax=Pseudomonas fluorescens TaxID=294 RepID=A0A5E6V239_PSEFL|nr:Sensor histidine kinase ResE [Pseudomonas fluorescens]